MGSGSVEAVGPGTVSASFSPPGLPECTVALKLNGSSNSSVSVNDGDSISVALDVTGECSCCEVQRHCNAMSGTMGLWVKKRGKENKMIELNRRALAQRMKIITESVKNKRNKLR